MQEASQLRAKTLIVMIEDSIPVGWGYSVLPDWLVSDVANQHLADDLLPTSDKHSGIVALGATCYINERKPACLSSARLEKLKLMEAVDNAAAPPTAQDNINTVVSIEEEAQLRRTTADRISDLIANFVGSIPFVVLHLAWFGAWVVINVGLLSGRWKFDPYPFALLCMLVSLEGVLLSTFVLIKQNRMSQRADQRAHLSLQINLLSEKELTKILQLQQLICKRLEIPEASQDQEVAELSSVTAVGNIAHAIDQRMPKDA
jgi:uncharacterized membrane protein